MQPKSVTRPVCAGLLCSFGLFVSAILLAAFSLPAAATTFSVAEAVSVDSDTASVTGTITTSVNNGVVSQSDITAWDLIIIGVGVTELTNLNSTVLLFGTALTVHSSLVSFDYDDPTVSQFEIVGLGAGVLWRTNELLTNPNNFCITSNLDAFSDTLCSNRASIENFGAIVPSATPHPSA